MKIIKNKFRISNHCKIAIPQIPPSSKQLNCYHLEAIENWINILQDPRETIPIIIEDGILF